MAHEIPLGLEAVRLLERAEAAGPGGAIHLTSSERRAEEIARFLAAAAPDREVLVFPPWDCLPFEAASPSPEAMGRRMRVLRLLEAGTPRPPILLTTPEAALQRVPPRGAAPFLALGPGDALDPEALRDFCVRAGYRIDERVDEPGEVAFRGEVVDVFPPACAAPRRIEAENGRIAAIRSFDPATQRSVAAVEDLALDAASELPPPEDADAEDEPRPGAEHRLPEAHPRLDTLFDHLPQAVLSQTAEAAAALGRVQAQILEAWRDRSRLAEDEGAAPGRRPLDPERLYLTDEEWREAAAARRCVDLEAEGSQTPFFAAAPRPRAAFLRFLDEARSLGRRTLFAAPSPEALARLKRRARLPADEGPAPVASWAEAREAPPGALLALEAPLERGFLDEAAGVAVVAAGDLLGSREGGGDADEAATAAWRLDAAELHIGDLVVHYEHGLSVLEGLETVAGVEGGPARDAVRLRFADDAILLAPVEDAGELWRYGSPEADVALDRLNGEAWPKRRAKIAAGLAETARGLVAAAAERRARRAPELAPPAPAFERFVARFPHALTPDQRGAVAAVLADMGSGAPMNRLVIGDVGFGKTEVALRAAAAAALAGKQVAVVAPTTVLARQHLDTFRRRFDGFGVEVAGLSRLVPPAESRATKAGLADGAVGIAVGTHALLGKGIAFADLGLLVIDEEQRFGAAHKRKLESLGKDVHVLAMTATPIPRTLQTALVGLRDLSVIATPPARRRPIRTLLAERAPATLRQALLREKRRGGRSFVVVPRVEDVEPTAAALRELVPRLAIAVAHGRMPAREVDEAMVGFASGRGDVLLATSIIESGLDVPRANTMVVLRPDLFGLAQLHQLRGRVGRGHAQAFCYLMNEPGRELGEAAARRLGTLQALDRLGAGMAISLHDLDLRGGGELFGEAQAGHVRLIGLGLYQDMLAAAVRAAKGEPDEPEAVALQGDALHAGEGGFIPAEYAPEPAARVNLYHRLARARDANEVDRLADEIADRFGPIPEALEGLFAAARVRALARALGVTRVAAGPNGVALSFRPGTPVEAEFGDALARLGEAADWNGERLLHRKPAETPEARRAAALDLLQELA